MQSASLTSSERAVVERNVAQMLESNPSYRHLAPAQQRSILEDTTRIVEAMAAGKQPAVADPYALTLADEAPPPPNRSSSGGTNNARNSNRFFPEGTAAGVDQAAALVQKVDFPAFVAELVQGTFHAIVQASIEQMKAYADLVKSVATSLNDFRDQNVSENQARDHLVSRYPNLLQINMVQGEPRVGPRPGAEFADLPDFQTDLNTGDPITDLDEETIEERLVPAARDDLARNRQKLLATMVLMGINRIVVTDGRINAKVRFTFRASDHMTRQATDYDYADYGTQEVEYDNRGFNRTGVEKTYNDDGALKSFTGSNRYATGAYTRTVQPVIQLVGQTDTTTTASLEAAGQLSGEVSINFKSDVFPLDRMADTNEIMQLEAAQGAGRGALPAGQNNQAAAG